MSDDQVKYPDICIPLTGEDGNAFAIMGRVTAALRRAGVDKAEIESYMKEAMGGNYDHLIRISMKWVNWS